MVLGLQVLGAASELRGRGRMWDQWCMVGSGKSAKRVQLNVAKRMEVPRWEVE